jgi:hypothetical protein
MPQVYFSPLPSQVKEGPQVGTLKMMLIDSAESLGGKLKYSDTPIQALSEDFPYAGRTG